jgi:cytochrome c
VFFYTLKRASFGRFFSATKTTFFCSGLSNTIWARATSLKGTNFLKMKYYFIILVFFMASCKKETNTTFDTTQPAEETTLSGETVFTQNNCAACHKTDQKVVGPSLQEIAKMYKEQNGDMVAFLKEEAEPIVDPTMYESMKINLQITKTLPEEQLKALEEYILSHSK